MMILALVGIMLVSLGLSDGQCMMIGPTTNTSKYGTVESACVYKGLRFLNGSSFELGVPDCLSCKCRANGMQCCSTNLASSMHVVGCRVVSDFCKARIVDENDPTKPCKPPQPPTSTSPSKKPTTVTNAPTKPTTVTTATTTGSSDESCDSDSSEDQ